MKQQLNQATLHVDAQQHRYKIHIEGGLLARAAGLLEPFLTIRRVIIISDETVWACHGEALRQSLEAKGIEPRVFLVPPGEASKSLTTFAKICDDILGSGIERKDCILAFGGGVIGDLAGYVAASLLRGIAFIQWPTTLLSQVDSSVGGKTGINSDCGKNLIGAFYQPQAVFIDTDLLDTLSPRQWRAGYAEVIKYGLLGKRDFFEWLENNGPTFDDGKERLDALVHAIATSCQCKADIVNQDERESGVRALLNLGHTFAHALEAAYRYDGRLIHGEAVSVGIGLAYQLAQKMGTCQGQDVVRVQRMLSANGLPVQRHELARENLERDSLIATMAKDKKASEGQLVFILPNGIGSSEIRKDVPRVFVEEVLDAWLEDNE